MKIRKQIEMTMVCGGHYLRNGETEVVVESFRSSDKIGINNFSRHLDEVYEVNKFYHFETVEVPFYKIFLEKIKKRLDK